MFRHRNVVIFATLIYAVLISVFVTFRVNEMKVENCDSFHPCIRFCCQDEGTCNDKYFIEKYNETVFTNMNNRNFKVVLGAPRCNLRESSEDYQLYPNDAFSQDGVYGLNEYCLDEDSTSKLQIYVCSTELSLQDKLWIASSLASSFFYAAIIFIYAYHKELRSEVSGKILLGFMVTNVFTHLLLPARDISLRMWSSPIIVIYMFAISIIMLFAWLSVLSFDIWWTLRNLKSLAYNGKRFTFYCFYVFGFVALLGFTILATHFEFAFNPISLHYFEFFVLASCFFDVIFMILAGFKIFSLTKAANRSTHHKFETEKKRFWSYLQLLVIMLIMWTLEIYSVMKVEENLDSLIITDVIRFVSAMFVFAIFVLTKNVRIVLQQRYGVLIDDAT